MHRSRLSTIVIDCNDIDAAKRFWTGALGTEVAAEDQPPYVTLKARPGGLRIVLQQVPEPKSCKSRVHLDFDTDDLEAEVRRLEALGATRTEKVEAWWIMQDPSGNEFCVVPADRQDLDSDANRWD